MNRSISSSVTVSGGVGWITEPIVVLTNGLDVLGGPRAPQGADRRPGTG